jgi:hypothetical protein
VVDPGTSVANLDPFVSARYAAEAHGAKLSAWPLLQFVEDGIEVAGLPVLTSTHVDAGTVA